MRADRGIDNDPSNSKLENDVEYVHRKLVSLIDIIKINKNPLLLCVYRQSDYFDWSDQ